MTLSTEINRHDIEALLDPASAVDAYVIEFVRSRPLPENLRLAIEYVCAGGKCLRPVLAIRCCESVGGRAAQVLPAAAAIEMIHVFSLVHDDLPAMDDDNLRRGRPTLHREAGEAMAILAGDCLMALAFELVATQFKPKERARAILAELAKATNSMIAGQVYDTVPEFSELAKPAQHLEIIHRHKTMALFQAACRVGAICGCADDVQLAALNQYGASVGLMFQIVDDLLDVTQTTEKLGKTAGKDEKAGKLTYPVVLGVEASRHEVERLHKEATASLEPLGPRAEPLRQLAGFIAVREQ